MSFFAILSSDSGLDHLVSASAQRPQVIFKHSTRCSISSMALSRLERSSAAPGADYHLLDLLAHRALSSTIATQFSVAHESPQVLIIYKGECIYDESHMGINAADIEEAVASVS